MKEAFPRVDASSEKLPHGNLYQEKVVSEF
jgi:hypothetical protein